MGDPENSVQTANFPDSWSHDLSTLTGIVTNRSFNEWYAEQQFEQNLLEGKSYFNGFSPPKPPKRHSPSSLLQCQRKNWYSEHNAPPEDTPPEGLYWFGTEFEEQVVVPYLQDQVPDNLYVQNSIWIDATLTHDDTTLQLKGMTDPAVVTPDGDPVLVTEIKTTSSLDHLSEPKDHHKAQLHAYLWALNDEYEHTIQDGLIVYGSRKTFDIEVYHVSFDPEFWQHAKEWMARLTEYKQAGELPPASPERKWECEYCSFRNRCGEADTPYQDIGQDGLLPLFDGYDRQTLTDYLDAHADEHARLTPTLAHAYPDLAEQYGAYNWSCPSCSTQVAWDAVEWDGDVSDPPVCYACLETGDLVTLSGPEPHEQLTT